MTQDSNQSTGSPVLKEDAADAARLNSAVASAKRHREAVAARAQSQRPEDVRERESNLGGPRLKMHVMGTIEGYHLYWENDQDSAIEQLLYDGFEFVTPEEVSMQRAVVSDGDVAHRVSRYVGTKSDNSPLRAYLMKCKNEIWDERQAVGQRAANAWDNAIRKRTDTPNAAAGEYAPKGVSNSFDTRAKIDLTANKS
jgi:hypothetical protein